VPLVLRTFLVLILLPGLLLPGGQWLRICLCTADGCCTAATGLTADAAAEAGACCQAPVESCCAGSDPAPADTPQATPRCTCVKVTTPEQPPGTIPGGEAGHAPAWLAPEPHAVAIAPPAAFAAPPAPLGRAPPRPSAPRNLPLLL
jgi:hypothetical protein